MAIIPISDDHTHLHFLLFKGSLVLAKAAIPILRGRTSPEWGEQQLLLDGLVLHDPTPSPPAWINRVIQGVFSTTLAVLFTLVYSVV